MYTKLFGSIVHSTIWREPNAVRLVWITMLALSDKKGCVWASVPGLADAARVSLEECEEALVKLSSPDPYSRTQTAEGRRIEAIDGGWLLINHAKFKAIKNIDERREQVREAVKRHRNKNKDVIAVINGNHQKSPVIAVSPSDHIRSDQTTTTTSSRRKREKGEKGDTSWLAPFCKSWESVNGAGSFSGVAGEAARALAPLLKNGHSPLEIVDRLDCYLDQTEPQFQSITRFAKTFAQWKPQPIIVDGEFTEYGERITRPASMR